MALELPSFFAFLDRIVASLALAQGGKSAKS